MKEKKMEYVLREKSALQILSKYNSFFVKLYCTFQDSERLYFVLTYAKNGELLTKINEHKGLDIVIVKYYAAEILMALELLNAKGIIHRDLKPENILFDENWHILITDFGSAKILKQTDGDENGDEYSKRRNSFVGTAQYVSPELLTDKDASFASDLWAFGCVVYQMSCGESPFRAGSEYLIFQKILKLEYEFPEGFDKDAKDLIEKLLVLVPSKRLGALDTVPYTSIRNHKYFAGVDFENLGQPPLMEINKLASSESKESLRIPDDLEPGLDTEKVSRLQLERVCPMSPTRKKSETFRNVADVSRDEIVRRIEIQKKDKWHNLVQENLILKQGLLDKRKGLFPRRRMFLLTLGPRLFYVDPVSMVLKGEIPWSSDVKAEAKNFKTFLVHTVSILSMQVRYFLFSLFFLQPSRIYHLEDPDGYAPEWCKVINEVKSFYYSTDT